LQVSGNRGVDKGFVDELSRLSREGYSIALKDFLYQDELRPLAEAADIVKLNVQDLDRGTVSQQVEALRPLDVKLLANGVETHEDYEHCKKLGFDYFEGYFFCKPQFPHNHRIPFNRLSTLNLLSKLQDPEVGMTELEHAVGQDVAMTYRILRYL